MAFIKEIELDNFKSFSGHVKLSFIKGFNAIAGANGSGKSNIIDAIMFVFGGLSKKEMRSELLTDLIFNGGKTHKEAEYTKVTLFFDNSDKAMEKYDTEVSLSRKIDKTGKSVFRVNGEASTREEIINLLSNVKVRQDGYNIIPQGKIVEIADSSPEEKLEIIKNISGISVFEEKKGKTVLELDKVASNISKMEMLRKEKKAMMEELDKEKKRALDFKSLKDENIRLSSLIALLVHKNAKEKYEAFTSQINEINGRYKSLSEDYNAASNKVEDMKSELNKINNEAESKGEQELIAVEKRATGLESELAHLKSVLENNKRQSESLEMALNQIKSEYNDTLNKKTKENESFKISSNRLTGLKDQREALVSKMLSSQEHFKKLDSLNKEYERVNKEILEARVALSAYPQLAQLQARLSELNKEKSKSESENKEITLQFSELKKEVDILRDGIRREEESINGINDELSAHRNALYAVNKATRVSAELKKDVKGVYGSVSELILIPNKSHIDAIFSALGRRSDFIIVESEQVAQECISKLKKDKLGIYTFIPINRIISPVISEKPQHDGVIDYLIHLVKFEDNVKNAMKFVFGDTILVERFDQAKSFMNKYRMVTLDGTVFEKTGAISGGSSERISFSVISRKYNESLSKQKEHTAIKSRLESEFQNKNAILGSYLTSLNVIEIKLKEISQSIREVSQEISKFKGSENDLSKNINDLEKESLVLEDQIKKLRSMNIERLDHGKQIETMDSEIRALDVSNATSLNKIQNIFDPSLVNLSRRLIDEAKEKTRFTNETDIVIKRIDKVDKDLKEIKSEVDKKRINLDELRNRRDFLSGQITEIETKQKSISSNMGDVQSEIHKKEVEQAQIKVTLSLAEEEVKKYDTSQLKLEENANQDSLKKQLKQIDTKLQSFGPINELAVDTYDKLSLEFTDINTKISSLTDEKIRIEALISEIDQKKTDAFMQTLNQLNEIFAKVYGYVTGGKAELVPENKEDIFSSGLTIKINLPNKKISGLHGLSGGEKSILSISLLMSISKYISVPFYVLDEVDAALDPLNASKFSSLVKSYASDTQFIIISHSETTLINADVIYGVTMDQEGISHVVSVKMPADAVASKH